MQSLPGLQLLKVKANADQPAAGCCCRTTPAGLNCQLPQAKEAHKHALLRLLTPAAKHQLMRPDSRNRQHERVELQWVSATLLTRSHATATGVALDSAAAGCAWPLLPDQLVCPECPEPPLCQTPLVHRRWLLVGCCNWQGCTWHGRTPGLLLLLLLLGGCSHHFAAGVGPARLLVEHLAGHAEVVGFVYQ